MRSGSHDVQQSSTRKKIKPVIDLSQQSVENPKGGGGRVNTLVADGNLKEYLHDDARTLYESYLRGVRESGRHHSASPCLGYRIEQADGSRPYHWISYEETLTRAKNIAKGMINGGLKIGQDSFVGIYSLNRPEWIIIQLACYNYSMVPVPLYDTLGPESCNHVINKTRTEIVFCDTNSKALKLIRGREHCPSLRKLVIFEAPVSSEVAEAAAGAVTPIEISTLELLESSGSKLSYAEPFQLPTPDDLAIICFTSGTTGPPKGAAITHGNIVAESSLGLQLKNYPIGSSDVLLSFLPLAHMFEQISEWQMFLVGATVGYFSGDISMLTEDLMELKPTILPVVPRLLNRIYDKSMQMVNASRWKRCLMRMAIKSKTKDLKKMVIKNNTFWDKLIFKKIRAKTGGRLRIMLTGSAPISGEVLTFVRCAMGCLVLEGYGQTENAGAATCTAEGDCNPGHVGPPIVHSVIKLIDVPEMGYLAQKKQGEILIRGPTVFKGYYEDDKKTGEALDADGWLHTGDVGEWTENGCLRIIDRKKNIFKLAQGEFVSPEKTENVYIRSRFVAQVFVDGKSLKASLVAIVVPDPEVLPAAAAKELGIKEEPMCASRGGDHMMVKLCENAQVKKMIVDDLNRLAKEESLNSFEQAKDIWLCAEQFSVENGLLTPTLKSIRPALRKHFEEPLEKMYKLLP